MPRSARLALANKAGGVAGYASKKLKIGRGETIKGRVILAIDPKAISKLASDRDIVLVSGTNGKTTTTANLAKILALGTDEKVSTGAHGANMAAGIAATLASKPRNRFVVLECDELYLPTIYNLVFPKVIVLLNLSRDQLHRTGEVRKVAALWQKTFNREDVTLIIDRDDPFLEFAVMDAGHVIRVTFGGRRHPDAATCPNCSTILDWTIGDYQCKCGLGSKLAQVRGGKGLTGPSRNAILAIEAARLMGAIVPVEYQNELTANPPDRTQVFNIAGRTIETRLAKNPESWRVGLTALAAPQIILALNARGIDGLDTSWLWDINYTELLGKDVICVGERKLDIAYRLSVQGIQVKTADSFAQAVSQFDNRSIEAIASYTAFQDLITSDLGISAKRGVTR
jgi:UDP-N-acetylmuramyl tripeptide synthase